MCESATVEQHKHSRVRKLPRSENTRRNGVISGISAELDRTCGAKGFPSDAVMSSRSVAAASLGHGVEPEEI